MALFYFKDIDPQANQIVLDKDTTRHLAKVLRKKTGDHLQITDGLGSLYQGEIVQLTSNRCQVSLTLEHIDAPPESTLHIAIAPTKMNDRMEWFLEKATEMGVSQITPLLCDHSERKRIKLDRFEKIIISATQQSQRLFKPILNDLTPFHDFVDQADQPLGLAYCAQGEKTKLNQFFQRGTNTIMIGPEGDFSSRELAYALSRKATPLTLGPTRLRTETAGVYSSALFNAFIDE